MRIANFSSNATVTHEGLNYTLTEQVDDGSEFTLIQIPFNGFDSQDFMELPDGKIALLSHFDVAIVADKMFFVKGTLNRRFVLLLFSAPWHDDGFIGDIGEGEVPEACYKLKSGHYLQQIFHEYLFVFKYDTKYRFGYCSEKDLVFLKYEIYCSSKSSEVSIRIIRPGDEKF